MLESTHESTGTTLKVSNAVNDRAASPDAPPEPPPDEVAETCVKESPADEPMLESVAHENAPPVLAPSLEDRVGQLEDRVASLQDMRKLEDRVTERVSRRLERKQANPAIKAPVAAVAEPSKPPPVAAIAPPPDLPQIVVIEGKTGRQPWLIVDIFTEFRAMLQMFLDARYRVFYMTWQTKLYPALLLGLIVVSGFTISNIPLVGPVMDRLAELVIAFFLYKVLSREANRYKEIGPQIRR
jgi:hypothetical protein